jgi:multiple sugar transport system substrate-binding protein
METDKDVTASPTGNEPSRKDFLRTAAGVAAAGAAVTMGIPQIVKAAGPATVNFWFGADVTGATQGLINMFNQQNSGKIKVVWEVQSSNTDTYFSNVKRALQAKSTTPDVFAGDVIWPAQLASQGLVLPLDKYWPKSEWGKYLDGPVLDVQYKGHIYAAPWFTDYGLIYYRTDLLAKYNLPVPTTWEQLQSAAVTLVKKGAVKEGFVFQGDQYEGLVCDALEYVNGAGGRIYGPMAAGTTAQAAKGLATMRSMITSGASPDAVTTYQEPQTVPDFVNGNAAFARNWNYMWAIAQDPKQSKVVGKVGVIPMLHEPGQSTGYSTLGGWNFFVNASSKNPDAAWEFINFMIGSTAQNYYAVHGGHVMVLKSTYTDPQVLKANPYFATVVPKLHILPRPTSPVYSDISLRMQQDFHNVLTGSMTPEAAVSDVEGFIKVAEARFQ